MALKSECPTLPKVRDDEDIFVLRAQDHTSGKMVLYWIAENFYSTPEPKLREAFECAMRMRVYKPSKSPD